MKHKFRINGEIRELDCELGSGYHDRFGNEIFEGDLVKYVTLAPPRTWEVSFKDGEFLLDRWSLNGNDEHCLEIVGHKED